MQNNRRYGHVFVALAALGTLMAAAAAFAEEYGQSMRSPWRLDVNIGAQSWQALTDLKPLDGGSFDSVGFNLSGAAHYSWRTFDDSELMIGGDLGFMSHSSSIALSFEDVTARIMYIGPSIKWVFGKQHDFSLDFGDVTGNDTLLRRTFGPVPGTLEGPVLQVQVGYRWR